jgi:hypothetical protein
MKKNLIITFHLSTGDNFTSFAIVLNYYNKYNNIHIFSLNRNLKLVKQLYKKYPQVIIHPLSKIHNTHLVYYKSLNNLISSLNNDYDILKIGSDAPLWDELTKEHSFFKVFYIQANLDYELRYKYIDFERDHEKENNNYNSLINKYGKNYIFVHDHRNLFYQHTYIRSNVEITSDLPIFHPNINYYKNNDEQYYNLWSKDFYYDNILDYCKIIENSTEIHISDSCFSCLCPYLDLSNVSKKYIYTDLNMIEYHKSFKDWIIKFD